MSTDNSASDLPARDPTKTNAQQGLYGKFRIERTDGSSAPGGKHHGCNYFVLDATHDMHAKPGLEAYAASIEAEFPLLADDMRREFVLAPAGVVRRSPEKAQKQCDADGCETGCASPGDCIASGRSAGDAAMPCWHHPSLMIKSSETGADLYCELCDTRDRRNDAEQREADLQADLVEERNRIASMRTEWGAEVAALTAQARHAEDCLEAAKARIADLESHMKGMVRTGRITDPENAHAVKAVLDKLSTDKAYATEFLDAVGFGDLPMDLRASMPKSPDVKWYSADPTDTNKIVQDDSAGNKVRGRVVGGEFVVDPMDWPLPCDVVVGHGTMRKGVRLGTLVSRMKVLYEMATGRNADAEEQLTDTERQARFDSVFGGALMTDLGAAFDAEPGRSGDLSADEAGVAACVTCGAPVEVTAPRDTSAMLAELMLLVTEVGRAGWACDSARLRAAELAIEASAKRMLGTL